jgi:putative tricarboxylic transport membrane protein
MCSLSPKKVNNWAKNNLLLLVKLINQDIIEGVIFLFFGLMIHIMIKFETTAIKETMVLSPRFWPRLTNIILILLSIGLIIKGFLNLNVSPRKEENKSTKKNKREKIRVLSIMLASIMYTYLFTFLGFIPSSILAIGALIYLFGERRLLVLVAVPFVTVFLSYFIFSYLFGLTFPSGFIWE